MKDKKFLELLNLYLDGEIDAAGAVELEQEILANPARRRVYNDYCRIHRATTMVYEQFRAAGDASETTPTLPTRRPGTSVASATGTFSLDGRAGGRATPRPFRLAAFATGLAAACAVGVFIGTEALAPRPAADGTPAPVVAATPPVTATPVVAATATDGAPANVSFTAPVAAEFRVDPFIQLTQPRTDPFALNSWVSAEENLAPMQPAANVSHSPMLKIDPRFRPATQGFELWPAATGTPGKNPFRLREEGRSADPTTASRSVAQ